MRILITGITGFAGGHLADLLSAKKGVRVYGLSRRPARSQKRVYACDMRDSRKLEKILKGVKPDRIFHLAAQSSVTLSWEDPKRTFEQNLMGALNLFEAARKICPRARIQVAGSAQEYGIPPNKLRRIDEAVPVNPLSPYAISKAAQDFLACQYSAHYGMRLIRTRAFNHIGPRQSPNFVTSNFARQIALIEAGCQKPEILVGDLEAVRDYTDVRDVVRAYWMILEKGKPGDVYNIASGQGCTARQILNIYLKLSPVKIRIRQERSRLRVNDLARLVGDPRKLALATGWKARIPLERSLEDILNFWREKIKNEKI